MRRRAVPLAFRNEWREKNKTAKRIHTFSHNTENRPSQNSSAQLDNTNRIEHVCACGVCVCVIVCCVWCKRWGRHKRQHQLTCLISYFIRWTQSYLGVRRRWIDIRFERAPLYAYTRHSIAHFNGYTVLCDTSCFDLLRPCCCFASAFFSIRFALSNSIAVNRCVRFPCA